jgi:hypothetical protein
MPANLSMLVHASVLSAWRVLVSRSPGRAGENELRRAFNCHWHSDVTV